MVSLSLRGSRRLSSAALVRLLLLCNSFSHKYTAQTQEVFYYLISASVSLVCWPASITRAAAACTGAHIVHFASPRRK
jgi:hypothetical protein